MGLGFSLRNLSFRWNLCSEISKGIPRALPTPQRPGDPLLHPGGPCRAAPCPPRAGGHQQRQQAGAFSPACRLCGPRRGSPLQTGRGRAAAWEPPSRNRQRRGPAAARGPQGGRNWGEWAPGRAGDGEGLRPSPPPCTPLPLSPAGTQTAPLQTRGAHSILALGRSRVSASSPRYHLNSREGSRGDSEESQACGHREDALPVFWRVPRRLCALSEQGRRPVWEQLPGGWASDRSACLCWALSP